MSHNGHTVELTEKTLSDCPLLRGMSSAELQQLLGLLEMRNYGAGDVILTEGESVQVLWIIVKGKCQVLKHMRQGGDQELAILDEGKVFGEMSFFHAAPHSATIRAITPVIVARLSRKEYDKLQVPGMAVSQKLAVNTVAVVSERLRTMDDWTCELVEKTASAHHRDEWRDFRSKLYSEWQF